MTTLPDGFPGSATSAEVLRRAIAIVPAIKARAEESEQLRRVAPESVKDVVEAGLIRSGVPRGYGGLGVDRDTALEIVLELSRGCSSTGWCTSIWMAHNWRVLFFPKEFQDEFYANGPDVICTDTGTNNWQKVEAVAGGYKISGQWSFGSGCDYADQLVLSAVLPEGPSWIGVPKGDFTIVDNWHVMGMRGTGSKDLRMDDAFVPAHRTVLRQRLETAPWTGHELHNIPSLCIPSSLLFTQGLTAPLIGIAQGAIDEFIVQLAGKRGPGRTADSVPNQMRLAEAQVATDTARLLLTSEVKEIIAKGNEGYEFTDFDRLRYRLRHAYAAELGCRAVTQLFEACGGHAIYESNPMQRHYRDTIAVSHHQANAWDARAEEYGRTLLGIDGAG